MEKTIETYFRLLEGFSLDENSEQEQKIYVNIFMLTLEYLVNVAKAIKFDKNERFYHLYKECEDLFIKNNTILTKEPIRAFKALMNEFFLTIGEKRINRKWKLGKFLIKGKDLIYQYFQQYRLDKNNDITKNALNSAIDIVNKAKKSFINKSRTEYLNNDFIPYLRNNADIHSESTSIYINEIFKTKTSIKRNSDDYEFFMKGLVAFANATMVDLIRLHDDNKLELIDIIGAFYDLMVLIKAHVLNNKELLIHQNL